MEDTIEDEGWPYEVTEAAERGPRHAMPYIAAVDVNKASIAAFREKLTREVRKGRHA